MKKATIPPTAEVEQKTSKLPSKMMLSIQENLLDRVIEKKLRVLGIEPTNSPMQKFVMSIQKKDYNDIRS